MCLSWTRKGVWVGSRQSRKTFRKVTTAGVVVPYSFSELCWWGSLVQWWVRLSKWRRRIRLSMSRWSGPGVHGRKRRSDLPQSDPDLRRQSRLCRRIRRNLLRWVVFFLLKSAPVFAAKRGAGNLIAWLHYVRTFWFKKLCLSSYPKTICPHVIYTNS